MASKLRPYLELRHRVRHLYLFDLAWSDIEDIAPALPERWMKLRTEIESFLSFLDRTGRSA
jgi:hypothetical protein